MNGREDLMVNKNMRRFSILIMYLKINIRVSHFKSIHQQKHRRYTMLRDGEVGRQWISSCRATLETDLAICSKVTSTHTL